MSTFVSVIFKLFLFCIIYNAMISCNETGKDTIDQENLLLFEFSVTDTLILSLDSVISQYSPSIYLDENAENSFLYYLNIIDNSIVVFNLSNGEIYKKLNLPIEGDDGFGKIEGFAFINKDTLIVNSRYNVSFLSNSGTPFFRWDFIKNEKHQISGLPYLTTYNTPVFIGDSVFLDKVPDIRADDLGKFKNAKIKFVVDFANLNQNSLFSYPHEYTESIFPQENMVFYSSFFNQEEMVFIQSFPSSEYIQLFSLDGTLNKVKAKSMFFSELTPFDKKTDKSNRVERLKHFFCTPHYGFLMYDKYRQLYYRYVFHAISEKDFLERKWFKKFSIIVLDKNFSVIGEYMPEDSLNLDCQMSFISKDGLHIKTRSSNEDELAFFCLEPKSTVKNDKI